MYTTMRELLICEKCFLYIVLFLFSLGDAFEMTDDLVRDLYTSYKDAVLNDNSDSFRRIFKNNKMYEVHVKKLKAVNGLKRHNLKIKEDNPNNPLIYIVNPVETKLPNAYLSYEEFKNELQSRALRLRKETVKPKPTKLNNVNKNVSKTKKGVNKKRKQSNKANHLTTHSIILKPAIRELKRVKSKPLLIGTKHLVKRNKLKKPLKGKKTTSATIVSVAKKEKTKKIHNNLVPKNLLNITIEKSKSILNNTTKDDTSKPKKSKTEKTEPSTEMSKKVTTINLNIKTKSVVTTSKLPEINETTTALETETDFVIQNSTTAENITAIKKTTETTRITDKSKNGKTTNVNITREVLGTTTELSANTEMTAVQEIKTDLVIQNSTMTDNTTAIEKTTEPTLKTDKIKKGTTTNLNIGREEIVTISALSENTETTAVLETETDLVNQFGKTIENITLAANDLDTTTYEVTEKVNTVTENVLVANNELILENDAVTQADVSNNVETDGATESVNTSAEGITETNTEDNKVMTTSTASTATVTETKRTARTRLSKPLVFMQGEMEQNMN